MATNVSAKNGDQKAMGTTVASNSFHKPKVAVVGASGYVGGELVRLLSKHKMVELVAVYAQNRAGTMISDTHPGLRNIKDCCLQSLPKLEDLDKRRDFLQSFDVLFFALPHGEFMKLAPVLIGDQGNKIAENSPRPIIIDLSSDFRVRCPEVFAKFYGINHSAGELHQEFVYGLAEFFGGSIKQSRLISNPGCFATGVLLGLLPLLKHALLEGKVVIDAVTGSSGSGTKLSPSTHHPERSDGFYAYKPFSHQHLAEIRQTINDVAPHWDGRIVLQTHSAPFVRGIFVTIHGTLLKEHTGKGDAMEHNGNVTHAFLEAYEGSPFIKMAQNSPNVKWVKGTNHADISWNIDGDDITIFVAIDNLLKGAAGQAIQNMNLCLGIGEDTGLDHLSVVL